MAESTCSTSSLGGSSDKIERKPCVICSDEGCDKIVKDDTFLLMLDIYWKSIGIDVKPVMNKGFLLCLQCYNSLLQFYEINDVLVYFETKLKESQLAILRKNITGIVSWQVKGLELLPFQADIMSEWGTKLQLIAESDKKDNPIVDQFKVTYTREDAPIFVSERDNVTATTKTNPSPRKEVAVATVSRSKRKKTKSYFSDDEEYNYSDTDDETTAVAATLNGSRSRSLRRQGVPAVVIIGRGGGRGRGAVVQNVVGIECKICLDTFPSSSHCSKHIRQHKVGENDGKYECRYCFAVFDRRVKIIDHKKHCNTSDITMNQSD